MNLAPVTRFVAFAHFAVAIAMVIPCALAWMIDTNHGQSFSIGMIMVLFGGGISLAIGQGLPRRPLVRSGFRELLIALLLFWTVVPITAATPFLLEGATAGEAWFEAVSALTTTGAWLSDPHARATEADVLYRASLQWLGGLITLATAAAVFVRPEFLGIAPIMPPFARGESGSYLRAFNSATWTFLPIYAGMTVIGIIAFLSVDVPLIDAMTMGASLIATGGLIPAQGGIASYGVPATIIAGLIMTMGAINFVVVASLALGRRGRVRSGRDAETAAFFILIPAVAILFWLSTGAGDVDHILPQLFNAISMLSTSGGTIGEAPSLVVAMVTAIVGGAAVSTAGGIKLLRWLITFRRTGRELWQLTHPGAVPRGQTTDDEFGVWIHALAFTMLLGALVLTTAFFGFSFEVSVAVAVAVISNTGPMLELAPDMAADYRVFDPGLRFSFGVGMIAGRLELVIMLVIINRRFWQG